MTALTTCIHRDVFTWIVKSSTRNIFWALVIESSKWIWEIKVSLHGVNYYPYMGISQFCKFYGSKQIQLGFKTVRFVKITGCRSLYRNLIEKEWKYCSWRWGHSWTHFWKNLSTSAWFSWEKSCLFLGCFCIWGDFNGGFLWFRHTTECMPW